MRYGFEEPLGGPTWTTFQELLAVLDEWQAARKQCADDRELTRWSWDRWPHIGFQTNRRWSESSKRQTKRNEKQGYFK